DESIETEVRIELHGTAPGIAEGGILELVVHTLKIECRATAIPDSIRIEIGDLHVGQGVHIRDLKLPEGVTPLADPDLLLVNVVLRAAPAEPAPAEGAAAAQAEPEVIGRKAEDKTKEEA